MLTDEAAAERPTSDADPDEAVVDLQCRFMDLELLVSELNEVVIELGAQLQQSERARLALAKRVAQLEASASASASASRAFD